MCISIGLRSKWGESATVVCASGSIHDNKWVAIHGTSDQLFVEYYGISSLLCTSRILVTCSLPATRHPVKAKHLRDQMSNIINLIHTSLVALLAQRIWCFPKHATAKPTKTDKKKTGLLHTPPKDRITWLWSKGNITTVACKCKKKKESCTSNRSNLENSAWEL